MSRRGSRPIGGWTVASLAAAVAIAVGAVVLVGGWALGIRVLERFPSTSPSLKPNTAIAFVLAGVAVIVGELWPADRRARWVARAAAAAVALVGLATVIEYLTGRGLGIDQLLFRDSLSSVGAAPPGRMGTGTAVSLVVVGVSLLARERGRTGERLAQVGAGLIGVIGFNAVLGYAYGVPKLETGVLRHELTPMSFLSALTLLVLAAAVIASLPRMGLGALLASRTGGGVMIRRLLPVAILAPAVFGFIRLKGQEAGWYGPREGLVVSTTSVAVIIVAVVTITAGLMAQSELSETAERARAETVRSKLEAQLRQAQKMEAIGNLAGGIAHDFNNLLLVIRGTSSLLLGRGAGSEQDRDDLLQIDLAAERAAALTQQLLVFSRQQVLRPELTDVNAVVAETIELLRRLVGTDIDLEQSLDPELPSIFVDGGQLGQVILNLALNARDAMPDGGTLTTRTGRVELDATTAGEHDGLTAGPYVCLQMADTGVGMTAEIRERVFDPFFTTKDGGTGLGLATAYGIVKQSGGDIWLDSELGLGTTFRLHLPIVDDDPADRAAVFAGGHDRRSATRLSRS